MHHQWIMPSCTNCGKPLLEGMHFCPYCGQPLLSEEMETFEPARGEVVTAIASPVRIAGMEGSYALAMTSERLLFARVQEVAVNKAKSGLRQAGIFLPGSGDSDNISRFYEMTAEQVLQDAEGNFSVDASEVSYVRLSYDSDDGRYVIRLRYEEGEITFTMPYERYYRDLLFRMFEDRITW